MARRKIDLVGQPFGKLIVIREAERDKHGHVLWDCVCSCGGSTTSTTSNLNNRGALSCGCTRHEKLLARNYKHGRAIRGELAREYVSWRNMMSRCYNSKHKDYSNYGGRGIRVCERWHDFKNFYTDMGECPPGLEIERLNNDGNYELDNCKWDSDYNQARNKRTNRFVELRGEILIITDCARKLDIPLATLRYDLEKYSLEEIIERRGLTV
jgi:hypothetical protein